MGCSCCVEAAAAAVVVEVVGTAATSGAATLDSAVSETTSATPGAEAGIDADNTQTTMDF